MGGDHPIEQRLAVPVRVTITTDASIVVVAAATQAEQRLAVPVREEALHLQLQRQVEQREATLLFSAHAS